MQPKRLFDLLRNRPFELSNFGSDAEQNPFARGNDFGGMDDFVRGRGKTQGLDKAARARRNGAGRFDDMVRSIDDLEQMDFMDDLDDLDDLDDDDIFSNDPDILSTADDNVLDTDTGEDDIYLRTRDPSYYRNEFSDESDIDDIDVDAGWKFMLDLEPDDSLDPDEVDRDLGSIADDMSYSDEEEENSLEDGDEYDEYGDDETLMDSDEDGLIDEEPDGRVNDILSKAKELAQLTADAAKSSKEENASTRYDGIVRSIKGAYLVSKEKQPDDTFTEVWIYNVYKNSNSESVIRKSILSGTDIDPTKNFSEDGSQEAIIKTVGNVQFVTLVGLPD